MTYRLSKESRRFYKTITDDWNGTQFSMWDYYYMCAMTGMSLRRVGSGSRLMEFSKTVESPYHLVINEMIAALVSSEIERKGLGYDRDTMIELFSLLTDEVEGFSTSGQDVLNAYAEGGYLLVSESARTPENPMELLEICQILSSKRSVLCID